MKLIGTIEQCGPYLAIRTSPNNYYPLGGNSGIASDFEDAFGEAKPHDIGKRLYRHSAGHLCIESNEQRDARAKPLRDYMAARELERVKDMSAFNVQGYSKRRKCNQHCVVYDFPDNSRLWVYTTRRQADAWHNDWKGRADDVHLGPVKGVPLRINRTGK